MNADVEEPGMLSELTFVLGNNRVGWVCNSLIVEPPSRKLGPRRGAGGERNVVALPRIRLTEFDLPLRVVAERWVGDVAGPGIDLPVREGAPRAGERIDKIPALRRLISGQDFADEALGNFGRRFRSEIGR